jgi:hypothetical protein
MGKNWSNVLRRKAKGNVLAAGQGARKQKSHRKRQSRGSQRHRKALRMPQHEGVPE